jgi:hypothetical protein
MKKNVFMYLAATALLVSCSKVEVVEPASDGVPVELSGVLNAGAGTRGDGVIGNIDTKPAVSLNLSVFRADQPYGTEYKDPIGGTFTTGGEIDMDPKQYYLADGDKKSKFIAVYPNTGEYSKTARTLNFTVDGTTDIIASQLVEGSKNAKISTPMAFRHLLTQIQVSVVADPTATDEEKAAISTQIFGKVSSIIIKNRAGTALVTLPAPTTDAGTEVDPIVATLAGDLTLFPTHGDTGGLTIPTNDTPAPYGYTILAPVTAEALTLEIETAGGTKTRYTSPLTLNKGNAYAIKIIFKTTGEPEIEGGGDGTDNDGATLAPWIGPNGDPESVDVDED